MDGVSEEDVVVGVTVSWEVSWSVVEDDKDVFD